MCAVRAGSTAHCRPLHTEMRLAKALSMCLAMGGATAFMPSPRTTLPSLPTQRTRSMKLALSPADVGPALSGVGQSIVAYSDELNVSSNGLIIGVSFVGITAALAILFSSLTKNLQGKTFEFTLSEEEKAAVSTVDDLFDATAEEKVLVESGTVGFVKRKELAEQAKRSYQKGKDDREVRDKTLYYAEVDLSFLAALLRVAQPRGGVFYDLGSGVGKAVFGAAKLYRWQKAVGVELLPGLHSKAVSLDGKFRRLGGSPCSFVNKDFTDSSVSLADADVIFAYATKYTSTTDGYSVDVTNKVLDSAPVGARIIILDRKLKGPQFRLLKTLEDPSGDLQRVRGFVYEKVA